MWSGAIEILSDIFFDYVLTILLRGLCVQQVIVSKASLVSVPFLITDTDLGVPGSTGFYVRMEIGGGICKTASVQDH